MSKQINIKDYISMYINEKIDILKNYPITEVQAVEVIFSAYENSSTVFAMANGGNAGTVDHLYCDFTPFCF